MSAVWNAVLPIAVWAGWAIALWLIVVLFFAGVVVFSLLPTRSSAQLDALIADAEQRSAR